jgi:hypothetical protein
MANIQSEANLAATGRQAVSTARTAQPVDGQRTTAADGNVWEYRAALGRGVNLGKIPTAQAGAQQPAQANDQRTELIKGGLQPAEADLAIAQQRQAAQPAQKTVAPTPTAPVTPAPAPVVPQTAEAKAWDANMSGGMIDGPATPAPAPAVGSTPFSTVGRPKVADENGAVDLNKSRDAGTIVNANGTQAGPKPTNPADVASFNADVAARDAGTAGGNGVAMQQANQRQPAAAPMDDAAKQAYYKIYPEQNPVQVARVQAGQDLIDKNNAEDVAALGKSLAPPPTVSAKDKITPLAKGGKVTPGKRYLVGEKGPEMFVPLDKKSKLSMVGSQGPQTGKFSEAGKIIPHSKLRCM